MDDTQGIPDWILKARNHWQYYGQKRPPFAIVPKQGQRSVWDFPRPPILEEVHKLIEVKHEGQIVAKTTSGAAILETASPPTYYIPPEDVVQEDLLKLTNKTSMCEWKGKATYWSLKVQPTLPVAWSYAYPFPPFEQLKDYFAFYPQTLSCFVNGERVTPQPGEFYAGWITKDLCGPFKGEPGTGHW